MAMTRKQVTNRLYIAVLFKNLSWACYFASVYAAMSLLELFQVQGINPKCESVKTSEFNFVVDLHWLFIVILKQKIRLKVFLL